MSTATRADIGKPGYAHIGDLLEVEYEQIQAEKERVWQVVVSVASSPGCTQPVITSDADYESAEVPWYS